MQKNAVCINILRAYTGIGDAKTQTPGMLRKPGDLPQVCPRPKKCKRLATRDALHGSRPNLRRREPDGRVVPIPSDVSEKEASTKICARRKKQFHNYTYAYIAILRGVWAVFCIFCLCALFLIAKRASAQSDPNSNSNPNPIPDPG